MPYYYVDPDEDLRQFKEASARLVREARKDPEVAERYLREAGIFDIFPEMEKKVKKPKSRKGKSTKAKRESLPK